jgi:hypothetical protein
MPLPRYIAEDISAHLDAIKQHFKAPKLTLLIRNPALNDGDVLLTDDSLPAVLQAIEHLSHKEEIRWDGKEAPDARHL